MKWNLEVTPGQLLAKMPLVCIQQDARPHETEHKRHEPAGSVVAITGLLILCVILSPVGISGKEISEESPTAKAILHAALQESTSREYQNSIRLKCQFVIRLTQVGDVEIARGLMNQVVDESKLGPDGMMYVSDCVGEAAKTAEMVPQFRRFIKEMVTIVQQRSQARTEKAAGNAVLTARIRTEEDIQLGRLYWQVEDFPAFKLTLDHIMERLQTAQWEPGEEFALAAILFARTGHDEEALKILEAYEAAYDQSAGITKKSPYLHWMFRVTYLAEVAQAQAEAGHLDKARTNLQRALDKAQSMPVSQLNDVLGNGTSLQSNAFKGIALVAGAIGEVSIAKQAQWAIADKAYRSSVVDVVIGALAKSGDLKGAQELVNREKCCWSGIALGLAEKGDWEGAVQADEAARSFPQDRKFGGMMTSDDHRSYYFQRMGEARVHHQGAQQALRWARERKERDRIPALLGVVDGLLRENSG